MITYQVKITIDPSVENEWLHWMKTVHVPDVIACGLVRTFQILKPTTTEHLYHFNYNFDSHGAFEKYKQEFAPELKEDVLLKYPNLFTSEREIFDWI